MIVGAAPGSPETIKPGLERILAALEWSGHPERAFRTFHVAGTNGKGSTSCFLAAILAGLRIGPVGLFTSPHLVSPEERIRVDGKPIPPVELRRLQREAAVLSAKMAGQPAGTLTYFEEMTWAACVWFRRNSVERVVMETGLGGRWDATNACIPDVSIVTTVGLDHREWLGNTLRSIAAEKAGILRPGIPAVIGRLRPAARAVVMGRARELSAPSWELGRDFGWDDCGNGRIRIRLPGVSLPPARPGMLGDFQKDNAAIACAAAWNWAKGLGTPKQTFRNAAASGISAARWPGRFSPMPGRRNTGVWVDGAHNPDAAKALARELAALKSGGKPARIIALWSMLRDKDMGGFLRELSHVVDGWVLFPMDHERAAPTGELAAACRREGRAFVVERGFPEGWKTARRWAGTEGAVVICGSLVAVGEAIRRRVGRI